MLLFRTSIGSLPRRRALPLLCTVPSVDMITFLGVPTTFFSTTTGSTEERKHATHLHSTARAANPNIYREAFLAKIIPSNQPSRPSLSLPLSRRPTPRKKTARASNPTHFMNHFSHITSKRKSSLRRHSNPPRRHPLRRHSISRRPPFQHHKLVSNYPTKKIEAVSGSMDRFKTVEAPSQNENASTYRYETVADYLESCGALRHSISTSTWVRVDNITPISSLDAMIKGIDEALDVEEAEGIIDLDQRWAGEEKIQFLPPMPVVETRPKWVRSARLILSPFSRPKGWFLQFDNRSIVNALLSRALESPVQCSYRAVKISACKVSSTSNADVAPAYSPVNEDPNSFFDEKISDHTLRVENCPSFTSTMSIINFFSRYDLKNDVNCVQKWNAITTDGRRSKLTYLVHFDNEYWARAALREKQSTYLPLLNNDNEQGGPLLLVQYPKQMW